MKKFKNNKSIRRGIFMMKTVLELCKPRESVFLDTTRDDVFEI